MTDRPLVSIVTPTLNQGQFIEATIRSIKAQTYDRFEHIVIDGGSTDGTLDILRRHEGTYPMRWQSEPDRGMYDAVNKGMRQATGDILCYLNSDDLYFPWTLETVVDAFRRWPRVGLVCGDCVRRDAVSGETYLLFQPPPYADYVQRTGFLAQPTVFWRRQVLDTVGPLDATLRYVADCDYWMRAMTSARVRKVDEFLAVDTIQAGALRGAGDALVLELADVRARHVRMSGIAHHLRRARNRLWGGWWRRASWLRLLAARRDPEHAARWSRWLAQPGLVVRTTPALLGLLPVVGARFAVDAVRDAGPGDGS